MGRCLTARSRMSGTSDGGEGEGDEAGVFGEGLEERGVAGGPTGGFEFCVRDAFMSPAALAVEVHWAVGWQGFAEVVCEVGVQFALSDGMIVDHVEEAAESVVHRVNHGGSSVVAVDLVDPPVSVAFNDRGSVEELSQQDAAGGAVNTAEAEH